MHTEIPHTITLPEFNDTYWLRSALVAFCRAQQLPAQGSKVELIHRISAHLSGKPIAPPLRKKHHDMPTSFTKNTVIGPNWHCSTPLRTFFQSHLKTRFTFTKAMRDFIANGQGKTLNDALHHWEITKNQKTETIAPQFEYNRFIRAFYAQNQGADHDSAIAAWEIHRDTPKSQRMD